MNSNFQSANLLSTAADFAIYKDENSSVKYLYFTLVLFANKNFWKMPLEFSDRSLALIMNLDVKTISNARDRLLELGVIHFERNSKGSYYILTNDLVDSSKVVTNDLVDSSKVVTNDLVDSSNSTEAEKYTQSDRDKRRTDAIKKPSKQNKTKQNKTKLTKQNDRSIARARKIENESENEYEIEEALGYSGRDNDLSANVNGVINDSSSKTGGAAISDTDKIDQSSVNDDQSFVKVTQNNSGSQTSKVEIKQITDDELRALAAFDNLIHQHSLVEREKLLALCQDFGADTVVKCISETNERLKQRGDRIQSLNLISTILNGGKKYERSIERVSTEDQESAERTRQRSKAAVAEALQNPQLQRMLAEYEAATANNDDKSNVDDSNTD